MKGNKLIQSYPTFLMIKAMKCYDNEEAELMVLNTWRH